MKTTWKLGGLALVAALAAGCGGEKTVGESSAQLRLARRPGGRVAVIVQGAPAAAAALQVELVLEGGAGLAFEDAAPADGLRLDTVRLEAAGAGRAILFAGDKRGVLMPRSGDVVTFAVAGDGQGSVRMKSAVLASGSGAPIALDLGPALVVR